VRRRDLGTRLRKLRTRSGLTQEEVAKQLECSTTKISRMETVARGSILRDVRDLCNIYGVTAPAGIRDRWADGPCQGGAAARLVDPVQRLRISDLSRRPWPSPR